MDRRSLLGYHPRFTLKPSYPNRLDVTGIFDVGSTPSLPSTWGDSLKVEQDVINMIIFLKVSDIE